MPLTAKGEKILRHMEQTYGEKKGKEVLYASKNKGTVSGIDNYLDACRRGDCEAIAMRGKALLRGR